MDVFEATVFASSVTGAYEKSLHMQASAFAAWANGFFFQLTEAVLRFDGVPIKYMGDQFLCFFSGADHRQRGLEAALLSKRMVSETLEIGLSSGEIYLGAVGHPDYTRPDIMGEVVNIAFLTMGWAETHAAGGLAATTTVLEPLAGRFQVGSSNKVTFKGIANPVRICEVLGSEESPA